MSRRLWCGGMGGLRTCLPRELRGGNDELTRPGTRAGPAGGGKGRALRVRLVEGGSAGCRVRGDRGEGDCLTIEEALVFTLPTGSPYNRVDVSVDPVP